MASSPQRLSRPVYEGLPWLYLACGIAALIASYLLSSRVLSLLAGLIGLCGVLGGTVILMRRRDYREMRSHYANPDSLGTGLPTEQKKD
jgi:membrane associated rhomboid family serine protease